MITPFPRLYEVDEQPGYSERYEEALLNFEATLSLGQASGEVAELLFFPHTGGCWRGRFRMGMRDYPTLVATTPNPEFCLVVTGGIAYRVNVTEKTADHINMRYPVTQIAEAPASELLMLVDFCDLAAIGRSGVQWRTRDLANDDLRVLSVEGKNLRYAGVALGETCEYIAEIGSSGLSGIKIVSSAALQWRT